MCSLPTVDTSDNAIEDSIWLIVKRTINGVDKVTLERIGYGFNGNSWANSGSFFGNKFTYSDCSMTLTNGGVAKTNWTISHLPNTLVNVMGDGLYNGQYTTDGSGNFTLTTAAAEITVGLPYTHRIETMPLAPPSQIGSGKGLLVKAHEILVGLYKSFRVKGGVKIEGGDDNSQTFTFSSTPYTGEQRMHLPGFGRDYRLVFEDDYPMPFELTYLAVEGQNYD
jgi:hypothetical protein